MALSRCFSSRDKGSYFGSIISLGLGPYQLLLRQVSALSVYFLLSVMPATSMVSLPRNVPLISAAPLENSMAEDTPAWVAPIQQNLNNLEVKLAQVHSLLSNSSLLAYVWREVPYVIVPFLDGTDLSHKDNKFLPRPPPQCFPSLVEVGDARRYLVGYGVAPNPR